MKWLFLVHQLRTPNSRERVKVWRLTRNVGALLYRNSVYVLPYSKEALEDFQWLCQEIRDSKGEASVFETETEDVAENASLRQQFDTAREREYRLLIKQIGEFAAAFDRAGSRSPFTPSQLGKAERQLAQIEDSFRKVRRTDFFNVAVGSTVEDALKRLRKTFARLEARSNAPVSPLKTHSRSEFTARLWATRPHIHIDRLCSAWLIRRFIDRKAKFVFASEDRLPSRAVPFDVLGAEFSHQGDRCTFETLLEAFRIHDPALSSLAELVHEIDLKDDKFNRPESAGLDMIVRSISDASPNDAKTLELGSRVLDAVYKRFSSTGK